jgi:predicted amidohydrolase
MKIAAVEFPSHKINAIKDTKEFVEIIELNFRKAEKNAADILILPGFSGCFYQWLQYGKPPLKDLLPKVSHNKFLEEMIQLSNRSNITLCPGSYWKRKGDLIYHSSCLIQRSSLILKQSQLYLAKWERKLSLTRGRDIELISLNGWNIALIISTDVFYPQVARRAALLGADLIISPIGFEGEKNPWLQLSGTWQTTQLNHYFAVESAFNGKLDNKILWGESIVHGPLPMTPDEDGILARTKGESELIIIELDKEKRKIARREFDALTQLNPEFYTEIKGLGGNKDD